MMMTMTMTTMIEPGGNATGVASEQQGFKTMASIRNLIRNRRGAAAAVFALTLPVMLAGMAMAIDYASFRVTHTRMQNAADAAALAAIGDLALDDAAKSAKALAMVNANLPEDFGDVTEASDITLGTYSKEGVFTPASGAAVNAARVVAERSPARGNAVNRIFSMFISNEDLVIRTVAIAARPGNVAYEPPEVVSLASDAWDFNELYAYCYNPQTNTRGPMQLIANNMRSNLGITLASFPPHPSNPALSLRQPDVAQWPACTGAGESVSFRLRNFRGANQNRSTLWTTQVHEHFTDTLLYSGVEKSAKFDATNPNNILVERLLCDTREACEPGNPASSMALIETGKTVANGRLRMEGRPCAPGKFMFYGWEDRPPTGSSDRDYNDITIRLRCPSAGALGGGKPRLVG
jgi:Flp pilus assembly protein TadG